MTAVPPGWHPDPSNPAGAVRWWDGSTWTSHSQPVVGATAPVAASPLAPSAAPPMAPPAYLPPASYSPPSYSAPGYLPAGSMPGSGGYPLQSPGAQVSFARKNRFSLIALAVVAVYVALAFAAHIVFLGIFPVLMAFRAIKAKEPLAVVAIVGAVVAIGLAVGFLS